MHADVTFCLLEQRSPDRADHPFTATMMRHFEKLGTPLRTLSSYPGTHTQTQRFQEAGYDLVECQSLWALWGDPRFLSPSQRMALDEIEPFDEWEEFALFASHYGLVVAQTGDEVLIPCLPEEMDRRGSEVSNFSDLSTRTVSPHREENQWFAYKYAPNPPGEGRTHHGSAYLTPDQKAIAVHGGIGTRGRQSTTTVYASTADENLQPAVAPEDIKARCCHTVSTLQNGQNLLCGGRTSPNAPFKDAWLQTGDKWERIEDMPEPRFRHRAAAVVFPDNTHGAVVFGGKVSASKVAHDVLIWNPASGWSVLRSLRQDPMPRFGATFARLGFNHGVMMGGMRQDGIICQGLWRWRLIVRNSVVQGIKFKSSTALDSSAGMYPWIGRLGASFSVIRSELIVIGGVAKLGTIPKEYEVMSFTGSFSAFMDTEKEMELRVMCVTPKLEPGAPRPLYIGHSTHRTAIETTFILGGGCTCFSFGSYWNQGTWHLHDREIGVNAPWGVIKSKPEIAERPTRPRSTAALMNGTETPISLTVEPATISDESDFQSLLKLAQPKIITNLDIGPCTNTWSPEYLKSKTSPGRKVVIHSSPSSTMNFQRKDSFTYTTLPFHAFLNIISSSDADLQPHMYLRSISATPTTTSSLLETDWPEIASDFHLPQSLSYITQNIHSSPLRISTNLAMFLHYDVMANILFHISSSSNSTTASSAELAKHLILFPPSDIPHLVFPHGSTTSSLDLFPSSSSPASSPITSATTPKYPAHTHPHLVTLPPNTALFIPPFWSHTAAPCAPGIVNISVNVFFNSLPKQLYAAGRDVYANRDLAAYVDGRRDLDKIARRFGSRSKDIGRKGGAQGEAHDEEAGGMPKEIAKAYLFRLADELRDRAETL